MATVTDEKKGTGELCEHCGNNTVYSYRFMGCLCCGAPICCSFCCTETTQAMLNYRENE